MIWWDFLFVCFWCFFHLKLADRQPFGVLRWFQLFCFFHLVSFFVCHQHLWFALSFFATGIYLRSVLSFFATGICVRSLSFMAFSAVLDFSSLPYSTCFRVSLSFRYHVVRLLLVSFILGDSNWIFWQVGYHVDSSINSALKQTPFGIPP